MRTAAVRKSRPAGRTSQTASIPAPVGGWNDRDPVADMDPRDALNMNNWFPTTGSVMVRKGETDHVTDIGAQVESLMPYNEADGSQTLFASANSSFYNVTSAGSVGSAVQSSLTNDRWQHVNFMNSSGTAYLCAFNGTDKPRYWDGSSWTAVDSGSSPAITGVTTTLLNNPWIHKRRMWMVEEDSLSAWYLPVDAVGGAATEFDLSGLFRLGGYLVAGGTWTLDAGEGVDDHWVVITSEGEVAVYQGTDPDSSLTWSIIGIWRIGEPIGNRCMMKYGGDLLVICKDGVYPLSKALQSSQVNPRLAITDKINGAMSAAGENYNGNFGWELLFYPQGNMVILNVPVQEGSKQQQYAMNTITGSWGRFTGIEANCWAMLGGVPYFGTNGKVVKFWQDDSDNGANIEGDFQQAFSYFGQRGTLKHFKMVRPIIESNGSPGVLMKLNTDYDQKQAAGSLSFSSPTAGTWDSGTWDVSVWGSASTILKNWQTVTNYGTAAGLRMKASKNGFDVKLLAVDYVYEQGGVV